MTFSPNVRSRRECQFDTPVASAARTTTGQTSAIYVGDAPESITLFVNATAVSGTSPSLVVSLEVSPDGGTTWHQSAAATAITAVGTQKVVASVYNASVLTSLYRVKWTITGTTPSFTFQVDTYTTRS